MASIVNQIEHTYDSLGIKSMRIQNSLSSIRGTGSDTYNTLKNQVTDVTFGTKVEELETSCFLNAQNLNSVHINPHTTSIGEYAFCNCTNLTSVNMLQSGTDTIVTYIGNYAFSNTGLQNAVIQLSNGGSYGASTGEYAFSDCSELTSVTMERNPYIGSYMFQNCTNLKEFTMADSHSYIGRNAFENCVSLKEITFPSKIYMLPKYFFKGCTNLSKVTFNETSELKTIENNVFEGCSALTSITLPSSVNSFDLIDDKFLEGSNISVITFNGLANDDIATEYNTPTQYTYETSCIYTDRTDAENIYTFCKENNVPLILFRTYDSNGGCQSCKNIYSLLKSSSFKEWLSKNNKYMIVKGDYSTSKSTFLYITKLREQCFDKYEGNHYANIIFYWKKEDGTESKGDYNGKKYVDCLSNFYWFESKVEELFSEYDRETEAEIELNPQISKLGSPLTSVTFISKTGTEFTCTKDYEETYEPKPKVDHETQDDFKYGTWYYNARQLKQFADTNNIPVFLEFSSALCEPCKDFKKNTFNNKTFQQEVKQKKCLLCRVELEEDESWSTPNTQPNFCSTIWGDKNISIPQTVYYWKKSDGTVVKNAYWYNYRVDPTTANYQTILSRIDELTSTYTPSEEYNPIEIITVEDKKSYKYNNQEYDTRGRYFIQDSRTIKDTVTVESGIKIGEIQETTLTKGENTSFEAGYTYLWYYPQTDYMYDRYGIIFKVDDTGVVEYIFETENFDEDNENYERKTNDYENGIIYSMTENTQSTAFESILSQAKYYDTQMNIIKMGNDAESIRIKELVESTEYSDFAAELKQLFVNFQDTTDSWSSNAAKTLVDFQKIARSDQEDPTKVFEPTTLSDTVPCLLRYQGCSQCTTSGKTVEYIKENIDLTDCTLEDIMDYIVG